MDSETYQRLKADFIRMKESGKGSQILLAAIQDALAIGEISDELIKAYQDEIKRNEQEMIVKDETSKAMKGRIVIDELSHTFGDLFE